MAFSGLFFRALLKRHFNLLLCLRYNLCPCLPLPPSIAGDLLENYCWDDDLMNFSRVLFSISILLTFPIECFVSREVCWLMYAVEWLAVIETGVRIGNSF